MKRVDRLVLGTSFGPPYETRPASSDLAVVMAAAVSGVSAAADSVRWGYPRKSCVAAPVGVLPLAVASPNVSQGRAVEWKLLYPPSPDERYPMVVELMVL